MRESIESSQRYAIESMTSSISPLPTLEGDKTTGAHNTGVSLIRLSPVIWPRQVYIE
jgi:hypothetical protein